MSDSENKKMEALIERALEAVKNKEAAKNSLALLFPRVERAVKTYAGTQSSDSERRKNRRFSISDFSENYFNLTPQSGSWGQSEFELAIRSTPSEAFEVLRRKMDATTIDEQSNLRRIFIELLDAEFSSGKELTKEWLLEILEHSQTLIAAKDEEQKFLFSVDNKDRLRWLILNGLERLPAEQVADSLRSAIQSANDLTVLCDLIRGIIGDEHEEGSKAERPRINLGEDAAHIREMLVGRVRSLAANGAIWSQAKPAEILWFWWGATKEDEVKAFANNAMSSPIGLMSLLQVSINRVRSTAKDYDRVSPTWEKLVDLTTLGERAAELAVRGDDSEREIAERFLKALKIGKQRNY